jgi:hypothetical protein
LNGHCLLYPLDPILHIVSGNTPHAALQTLVRGIIVGATNRMKLPQTGLPELNRFVSMLPKELHPEMATDLPPGWMEQAEAIVVFGSDETILEFSRKVLPAQRFLAHGHKISFGLIRGCCDQKIADGIARDVFAFDQLGCLSPQFFYVAGDSPQFASQLSKHFEEQSAKTPPVARAFDVKAALRSFREEWKFRAATESGVFVWESPGTLDWVIVHDPDPGLAATPLHGTLFVKPMPSDPGSVLTPVRRYIGTIGVSPLDQGSVELAARLGAQRICEVGQMQNPPLSWHHDGWPSLISLVRFVDVEGLVGGGLLPSPREIR